MWFLLWLYVFFSVCAADPPHQPRLPGSGTCLYTGRYNRSPIVHLREQRDYEQAARRAENTTNILLKRLKLANDIDLELRVKVTVRVRNKFGRVFNV